MIFSLIQQLWDRGEANGYAHHMTDDPLADTPAHTVLLHPANGDHQVAVGRTSRRRPRSCRSPSTCGSAGP